MTKNTLKKIALKHFAIHGYEGASLANIAEDVGIKKQSIAAHFKTKEELYIAVLNDMIDEYIVLMETVYERLVDESIEKKLFEMFYHSYQYKENNSLERAFLYRVIHFSPPLLQSRMKQEILRMEQRSAKMYRSIIEEGIQKKIIHEENIEDVLATFYCLIDGVSLQMYLYDNEEFHQRFQSIWRIFWKGITQ